MAGTLVANALDAASRQCRDMDAAVNERLACSRRSAHRLFAEEWAVAVDRLVRLHRDFACGAAAPMSRREPMPPFMLPDEAGASSA